MKKSIFILIALFFSMAIISCNQSSKKKDTVALPDISQFKGQIDGKDVSLFYLKNKNGMEAAFTNFGARVVALIVKDKDGNQHDVVLGFNKATDYNNPEEPYYGAIVGPFANRIANGTFSLDGQTYHLPQNNGRNTLHGGLKGLHFQVWDAKQLSDTSLEFTCNLSDGTEGFPGNRQFNVTYTLTPNNELVIHYEATTDKPTVINLSNHSYFNLNGEGNGTILNQKLQIFANQFTPVDSTLIPTGKPEDVKGTPLDFTQPKTIGKDINVKYDQLAFGRGYDFNYVLSGEKEDGYNLACKMTGDKTGIVMEILTDQPGLQFYSGNFMADRTTLSNGVKDSYRTAVALEPQHFPDSPNQPDFPSTILNPGEKYQSTSVYRFSNE
ncbi:MAG: galactose mutarotase [Chitinophagaceae bacterium]|nr:galactose mutarotase [Chitinophagaceae bacterium]